MYNYFMLIGNLVSDPRIGETPTGKKVTNIRLAVRRSFKNSEGQIESDFFDIELWSFLADVAGDSLKKGAKVAIKGRFRNRIKKTDKGDFNEGVYLVGEQIIFLNSLKEEMYRANEQEEE